MRLHGSLLAGNKDRFTTRLTAIKPVGLRRLRAGAVRPPAAREAGAPSQAPSPLVRMPRPGFPAYSLCAALAMGPRRHGPPDPHLRRANRAILGDCGVGAGRASATAAALLAPVAGLGRRAAAFEAVLRPFRTIAVPVPNGGSHRPAVIGKISHTRPQGLLLGTP